MTLKIYRLEHNILKSEMTAALDRRGVEAQSVADVTAALIETSLRGVDSHGINLFPHYCRAVDSGRINKQPRLNMVRKTVSAGVLDADHGFGHRAGHAAMDIAVEMAGETGIGAVAVRNSSHFAAAGYYGMMAARCGHIGLAFTNADALVKAHGSPISFFGTNPICIAAPMADEAPFCLDMATSQISWNKILGYRRSGQPLEPNWAFNEYGGSTESADAARSLAPAGQYKGFGLGMAIEILCGLLTGGPVARELIAMYENLPERRHISHFFIALNIESFVSITEFCSRLSAMAKEIRSLPALDADHPPQIPGDPEKNAMARRLKAGIPMDSVKFDEFLKVSPNFSQALLK